MSESNTWRFLIGETAEQDRAVEIRRTQTGPHGMTIASFGPGQFGTAGFQLENFPRLEFSVKAERIVEGTRNEAIPAAVHVVNIEPRKRQYRCVVQFCDIEPLDVVEWSVSFRWPGLWRSLRDHGRSTSRITMNQRERPRVRNATIEVVADATVFPDLDLVPLTNGGDVHAASEDGFTRIVWTRRNTPSEMAFHVISESRRSGW